MLVSDHLRLLFTHVPKTGGSSITAALRPFLECSVPEANRLPVDTKGWQQQWHAFGGMHSPFRAVEKQAQPLLDKGYRMATSVRSPFERLASMWAIKTKAGMPNAGMDPYEFLTKHLPGHCLHTIEDMTGPRIDLLIRFETLEKDWAHLCEASDVELIPLPHANKQIGVTPEIMERVYSDQRCIDFVLEHLAGDVLPFGYSVPGTEPFVVEPKTERLGDPEE